MKDLLGGFGYDTVIVSDGEAAARVFAEEKDCGRPVDLARVLNDVLSQAAATSVRGRE